jgi:hypothetical protein
MRRRAVITAGLIIASLNYRTSDKWSRLDA